MVESTARYPEHGNDGITVTDNLQIIGIEPESWACQNTNLREYAGWSIQKINDHPVPNIQEINKILRLQTSSPNQVKFTLVKNDEEYQKYIDLWNKKFRLKRLEQEAKFVKEIQTMNEERLKNTSGGSGHEDTRESSCSSDDENDANVIDSVKQPIGL